MENYIVSARKYRPQTFESVVGQQALTATLQNAIRQNHLAHAYLFCGPRGVGKTTCARIFAKTINCLNPQNGYDACNECESCKAFNEQRSFNIHELDAASNNSVDDIRSLIDQVRIPPQIGKYSVYIIDEVHMLSAGAFNALLKTLEEPPSYVIFILATTEPNKLPVTILSRCQRYDFGRLSTDVIEGRLREVAQMEGLEVEDKAFRYIAGAADGSMRDGLSLLDQCNAFNYGGGTLTYERTLEILGAVDTRVFGDLYLSIHEGMVADALKVLDEILLQGRELMQFVTDFTWYLRNLMLLKASEETARSLDISADNLRLMIDQARMSDMEEIMRCIKVFSALPDLIRYSPNRRILTEMTIIRACRSAMDDGAGDGEPLLLDKIKNRIREMETQLYNNEMAIEAMAAGAGRGFAASASGSAAGAAQGRGTGSGSASPAESAAKAPAVAQELPPALPGEIKEIVANWSKYASEAPRGSRRLALRNARLSLGDHGQLLIIFEKEYGNPYMYQRKDDNGESTARVDNDRRELQQYLQSQVGKAIEIEYRVLDRGGRITDNYVDLLSLVEPGAIRMSVETEDL